MRLRTGVSIIALLLSAAGCGSDPDRRVAPPPGDAAPASSTPAPPSPSVSPSASPSGGSPTPKTRQCPWSASNPRPYADGAGGVTLDATCLGPAHGSASGGWLYGIPDQQSRFRRYTFDNGVVLPLECVDRTGRLFSDVDNQSSRVWVKVAGTTLGRFPTSAYVPHATVGYVDITGKPDCPP